MSIFDKADALEELREDRMPMVLGMLGGVMPSSRALWNSLMAAEAEVGRKLGVSLVPIEVFSVEGPTEAELAALGDKPYVVEPGYDMEGGMLGTFQWGSILLGHKPLIEVVSVNFVYPTINKPIYEVPKDWIYPDYKAGLIQFSPKPTPVGLAPSILAANIMARGGTVPQMVRVRYRAGLTPKHENMIEIRDLIMRATVLHTIRFTPQSGSISADGMSQSKSIDVDKFGAAIDDELADLRKRLNGPTWGVL